MVINKTKELSELLASSWFGFPSKLFLVLNGNYYYSTFSKNNIHSTLTTSRIDYFSTQLSFKPDRWKILDIFSMFEFILWQILFAMLNPTLEVDFWNRDFMNEWDMVLDNISFDSKIRIIKSRLNWKERRKIWKLDNLKWVRNQFAHTLNIKYIEYCDKFLHENYELFKKDVLESWELLIWIYVKIWNQEDLQDYIISQYTIKKEELSRKTVLVN